VNDTFGESGEGDELLEKYGLSSEHIIAAARRAAARKT
jgi:transketolase